MMNDRPVNDPYTREALSIIAQVIERADLAGAVALINANEWAFYYHFPATWNASVRDDSTPLGFRIRAREAELGRERAEELILGTAFTITSLKDFGTQTQVWSSDLIKMLKKVGLNIHYRPFNGHRLQHLSGMDMRPQ